MDRAILLQDSNASQEGLPESRLLPFLSSLNKMGFSDAENLVFLYLTSLQLLRLEHTTQKFAQHYAEQTLKWANFQNWHANSTDVADLLHMLLSQHKTSLDVYAVKRFLNNIRNNSFDQNQASQVLLKIENQLGISTQNYRSIRRIVASWHTSHIDLEGKKLCVTRLLQALRAKAASGDIFHELEHLARSNNWELKDVCDPETGQGCDAQHAEPAPEKKKLGLLKQLAITTGIGIGAYYLGKALAGGLK